MGRKARILTGVALFMLIPWVFFLWLQSNAAWDLRVKAPMEHFYIVSIVSAIALALAAAVGYTATQLRNIKISFLALSYISLAAMFVLHGLATPGFLSHHSGISGSAAQLSLLLAIFWLWLSSMSADRAFIRLLASKQRMLMPIWSGMLLSASLLLWFHPHLAHYIQFKDAGMKWTITLLLTVLGLWSMYRYLQSYRLSRFPLQLAIVYSAGWMLVAQYIMVTGQVWYISWWLYHFLLLGSLIIMVGGMLRQYVSSRSFRSSMKLLFRTDPRDWLKTYISPSVKSLIAETEARDAYTAGHNYRVALYALKLGEELALSSDKLRAIAQGGIVHDIGKLSISDRILNKPGSLTPEERAVIELHPVTGYDLCKRLGFMPEELSVIRSHHERWDGDGYPDRLSGVQIPHLARIIAVADVYDALTSSRSYRKAMSHDEATGHILRQRGKHFDPDVVDAWVRLVTEQAEFFRETAENSRHLKLIRQAAR
ncbi:HD-GYP domain-containing protein [Paenibacillus sp. GCM10023252]|uniref:HD-GYP domain-containing protein n=1 Tax=Paenibacillus sp. GCM10023252 TaxID=3252649 RepID=UPI00361F5841